MILESVEDVLKTNKTISKKTLKEKISESVDNFLNELSHQTIMNAVDAHRTKHTVLKNEDGVITKDRLKKFIKDKNPSIQKRYIKLWKEGKLEDYLIRQTHLFATVANSGFEWIRDNTDVPISPEFFEGDENSWGKGYKNTKRKPTKDEHDFYRFVSSGMSDVDGLTEEQIQRYTDAMMRFFDFRLS